MVDFDNPHLAAGTPLAGEYPAGLILWSAGSWQISAPAGGFGTFHLVARGAPTLASFRFVTPQVLLHIDAFNPGAEAAKVRLQCDGGGAEFQATWPAGRVQRLYGREGICRRRPSMR